MGKNKIIIIETDKAYLLSKCDKILIIENGKTVEYGKYEDLMANKSSKYYKKIKNINTKERKVS